MTRGRRPLARMGLSARRIWLALSPDEWRILDWFCLETGVNYGQAVEGILTANLRGLEYLPDGEWNELVLRCAIRRELDRTDREEVAERLRRRREGLRYVQSGLPLFPDKYPLHVTPHQDGATVVRDPVDNHILTPADDALARGEVPF